MRPFNKHRPRLGLFKNRDNSTLNAIEIKPIYTPEEIDKVNRAVGFLVDIVIAEAQRRYPDDNREAAFDKLVRGSEFLSQEWLIDAATVARLEADMLEPPTVNR